MAFGGSFQQKMSEESFDILCNTCEKTGKKAEAVKYCVECAGYCCQPCIDMHQIFPTLKNHNLLDIDEHNQPGGHQSTKLEFPTERCSLHKGKVVDLYCDIHDDVGCYVCIAKGHKGCQETHIHSIPDMIDTIFNSSDCMQTQRLLKDALSSMETISKSTGERLEALKKAKGEAMGNVDTYQKALETILRKAAESSRSDVERVYKKLEKKVLDEQHAVDTVHDTLKDTDDKLQTSEANRAQRFVCYKIAKGNLKLADKIKQDLSQLHSADSELEFIPDKSLLDIIKRLQGIGRVQSDEPRRDLYRVKGCRDINIKLPDDTKICHSVGSCLTPDNKLIVTDFNNSKLKLIDLTTLAVVNLCTLDLKPICVCCVSHNEVAVTCEKSTVQFVSIQKQFTVTRKFKTSRWCFGIAYLDNKLYVTDADESLYIYDMKGVLLNTVTKDNWGNKLFQTSKHVTCNEQGTRLFVGGGTKGIVCFDVAGRYMSTIGCTDDDNIDGVCVDKGGNVIAGDRCTNGKILQYSGEDGKKIGIIEGKGLPKPRSICFHAGMNKLFVTLDESNVAKMYELE